jgi:S1-C subfamily serine protease
VRGCNTPKLTVTRPSFRGRPPSPPRATPSAPPPDFGMSVACGDCGWRESVRGRIWSSTQSLEVLSVDKDGPADRGGIRAGDRILAVDGHSLSSLEGGRYLGGVKPGQQVRFAYERNGRVAEAVVTARERSGGTF